MNGHLGNGRGARLPSPAGETRWIEIDLADLGLPADMPTRDDLAVAAAHVYERFVAYADDGWEWVTYPGSRDFDGWVYSEQAGRRGLVGARLLSRRAASAESASAESASAELPSDQASDQASYQASHGVSAYRTRQLTGRSWTAEPGSKAWRPFS